MPFLTGSLGLSENLVPPGLNKIVVPFRPTHSTSRPYNIADLESANDAKQRRIDELEERVNALVARMEAVESA